MSEPLTIEELLDLDDDRQIRHAGAGSAPQVCLVAECRGRRWAVDPRDRVAYVLQDPDPAVVGARVTEALAALADHERPTLRVLAGGAR